MNVFFLRHQAAGVLWNFPFSEAPSEEQTAAVRAYCERTHGKKHPKTDEPFWLRVVEAEVHGPSQLPKLGPTGVAKKSGEAPLNEFKASGTGVVKNPE